MILNFLTYKISQYKLLAMCELSKIDLVHDEFY